MNAFAEILSKLDKLENRIDSIDEDLSSLYDLIMNDIGDAIRNRYQRNYKSVAIGGTIEKMVYDILKEGDSIGVEWDRLCNIVKIAKLTQPKCTNSSIQKTLKRLEAKGLVESKIIGTYRVWRIARNERV